ATPAAARSRRERRRWRDRRWPARWPVDRPGQRCGSRRHRRWRDRRHRGGDRRLAAGLLDGRGRLLLSLSQWAIRAGRPALVLLARLTALSAPKRGRFSFLAGALFAFGSARTVGKGHADLLAIDPDQAAAAVSKTHRGQHQKELVELQALDGIADGQPCAA